MHMYMCVYIYIRHVAHTGLSKNWFVYMCGQCLKCWFFTLKAYKQGSTTLNILSGNLRGWSAFPLKQNSSPHWISYEVSSPGDSVQFFMDGMFLVSYNSHAV